MKSLKQTLITLVTLNAMIGCSSDLSTQADALGAKNSAAAGKVLVEKSPCDMDIFITVGTTRCVQYRGGSCHDYIYKPTGKGNPPIEDRGEFACQFSLVSGNAEKKDRTRIKLTGGTLNYDVQFSNGFSDAICGAKTSTDMKASVGDGRWTYWAPSQNTCESWVQSLNGTSGVASNPNAEQQKVQPADEQNSQQSTESTVKGATQGSTSSAPQQSNQNQGNDSGAGGGSSGGSGNSGGGSSNSNNDNSSTGNSIEDWLKILFGTGAK